MDRVEVRALEYLEAWNNQYAHVRDAGIVKFAVEAAMSDIEQWIEGQDPNGAKARVDVDGWSDDELIHLYRCLAPSASFFCYPVRTEYLTVTDSSAEPEP